ncbi:Choline/Carnitine o-acyltransferase-domain-containing protein [Coniella lustricola]|uniref:Choline/Carnitine o-acyltransferase-domain-containing protein n=1 Tax=Coniella lustricola TaxID=2025994 RepID=A0A2T3A912_9PEZI|nr:Choline/Carnitine o-acyltransferase-domain-containing protein [Coniella lustricola]
MPTKVRIFTVPKSLGETLTAPSSRSTSAPKSEVPRSIPIYPEIPTSTTDPTWQSRSPQTRHNSNKDNSNRKMGVSQEKSYPGVTFAKQDKLPTLPIPDLESSCTKYLQALRPLQSAREHADTKHAVQEFLAHEGPDLQDRLKKYAEGKTSYIEQFWYDSYLNYDNPVVLNLNPFFLLEDDPTPARNNQVTRAASLVVSALEFVRAVRKEELPPDTIKGTPLDMYQYSRLFGTARVPTDAGCQIEQDPDSKHIVVMCHGQFYWFDVLDDNSDVIMTEKDVSINLQTVIDDAAQTPIQDAAKGALGVLSTENRKVWSGLRDVLTREEGSNNADCLGIVDSALFIVCLDYTEPMTVSALCQNMLCGTSDIEKGVQIGTCTNRWYDKLQIIVCKNGSAGINFEHTGVDGHTVLRFASDVYTDTILRFARTINGQAPTLWASTSPDPSKRDPDSFGDVNPTPHKLEWDMLPELKVAVRFAETRLADLIGQNEFECLDFQSYGKNFITSMGFSPDAFVQMAFQAAYFGLYGRVECTYEPAMTKAFLHGRTEAIRTVSDESVNFVQNFWGDHPAEQKVEALKRACSTHVNITKECAKAQGCDRHLYALFCLWQRLSLYDGDSDSNSNANTNDAAGSRAQSVSTTEDGVSAVASGYTSPNEDGSPTSTTHDNNNNNNTNNNQPHMVTRARGDSTTGRSTSSTSLPLIFADSGWDRLNTTIISTSNCGNPSLRQFGFGPVSGDGFGIGYIIKDDGIAICASSKHRQTRRFVDTLEAYLLEIRRILRITSRNQVQSGGGKTTRAREIDEHRKHSASSSVGGSGGGGQAVGAGRDRPGAAHRPKVRGRLITGGSSTSTSVPLPPTSGGSGLGGGGDDRARRERMGSVAFLQSPEESLAPSDDDELGGYGFFDAGMLLQALKARGDADSGSDTKTSERAAVQARRRDVGKKLRLIDY